MFWKKKTTPVEEPILASLHTERPVPLNDDPMRVARNESRLAHITSSIESFTKRLEIEPSKEKRRVLQEKIQFFKKERTLRLAMKEV